MVLVEPLSQGGALNKLAWAYRQRECGGPREKNGRCRYGSSSHTTWWTPRGLGIRRTQECLTWHQKTAGGGSQNHLKSYLRVPKTVTREEAYKGGQKLQTYSSPLHGFHREAFVYFSCVRWKTDSNSVRWNALHAAVIVAHQGLKPSFRAFTLVSLAQTSRQSRC